MLRDKVSFTGLELLREDIEDREVQPPWPQTFHSIFISDKNNKQSIRRSTVLKYLKIHTKNKYGVYEFTDLNYNINLIISFEDANEAMLFKLCGIDAIEKEEKFEF